MKLGLQLLVGLLTAAGLAVATVALWMHTWIIFAAPVGALGLAVLWVTLDNLFIYPRRRARTAEAAGDASEAVPAPETASLLSPPETGE